MTLALSALVALVLTGAQENPPKKEEPTSAAERLSGRLPSEPAFHRGAQPHKDSFTSSI